MKEEAEEYLDSHDCEMFDNKYVLQIQTVEYEYDADGRLVSMKDTRHDSPQFVNMTLGYEDTTRDIVTIYSFDYNDPDLFSISIARETFENEESLEIMESEPFKIEILYNENGFPVQVGSVDTDIYEELDCEVTEVKTGYFGYFWNDTMTHFMGEVHGGIAGLEFNSSYIAGGYAQAIRVTGVNDEGQKIIYYMQPDTLGREIRIKFTDDIYTLPLALNADPNRMLTLTLGDLKDVYLYERFVE